jgi:hypothetical protein
MVTVITLIIDINIYLCREKRNKSDQDRQKILCLRIQLKKNWYYYIYIRYILVNSILANKNNIVLVP